MACWADLKHLQSQCNNIKDNNNIKFSLAHIEKLQNIAEVGILASNKIALSTKNIVDRKKVDVNIRKKIYIIN